MSGLNYRKQSWYILQMSNVAFTPKLLLAVSNTAGLEAFIYKGNSIIVITIHYTFLKNSNKAFGHLEIANFKILKLWLEKIKDEN